MNGSQMLTFEIHNHVVSVAALSIGSVAIPTQRVGCHTDLLVNFCARVFDGLGKFNDFSTKVSIKL